MFCFICFCWTTLMFPTTLICSNSKFMYYEWENIWFNIYFIIFSIRHLSTTTFSVTPLTLYSVSRSYSVSLYMPFVFDGLCFLSIIANVILIQGGLFHYYEYSCCITCIIFFLLNNVSIIFCWPACDNIRLIHTHKTHTCTNIKPLRISFSLGSTANRPYTLISSLINCQQRMACLLMEGLCL